MKLYALLSFLCRLAYGLSIAYAATWDTSLLPGTRLEMCQGQNISFPWRLSMSVGEQMSNWRWERNQLNQASVYGENRQYTNEAGKSVFSNDPRFTFGPELKLKITGANVDDTGNYTVTVIVRTANARTVTKYRNSVSLLVKAKMAVGALEVQLDGATTFNNVPNAGLELSCGYFENLSPTDVTVIWTIPSGQLQPSTAYHDGYFFLLVPAAQFDPGNYSCQIHPQTKAFECVEHDSPLRGKTTLDVSPAEMHLALLEGELDALELEERLLDQETRKRLQTLEEHQARTQESGNKAQAVKAVEAQMCTKIEALESQQPEIYTNMTKLGTLLTDWTGAFSSCLEAKRVYPQSGVRTICIAGNCFNAFCDQDVDGGGWTVIQSRKDGSEDFGRNMQQYINGFGNTAGEYWLGLNLILLLTASGRTNLRIDLWDKHQVRKFARYGRFYIDGPEQNYRLHVDTYWGDAGDSLRAGNPWDRYHNNNQPFSTYDNLSNGNTCAKDYMAGWWFHRCFHANLNGRYSDESYSISWGDFSMALKRSEMKVR